MSRTVQYSTSQQAVDLGRDNQNLVAIAQDVAIDRARAVSEALCHMAAIRSLQTNAATGANAVITCTAAAVQDAKATQGHQAAHLLPGQIKVNHQLVWNLVRPASLAKRLRNTATVLQLQTQACFAETNVLPAIFNRADSQAEKMASTTGVRGLKELFAEVTGQMWRNARVDPNRPMAIDRTAVIAAINHWFHSVSEVYEAAADRKIDAWLVQELNQSAKAMDRELESQVLIVYHNSLKIVNGSRFVHSIPHHAYMKYDYV